MYQTVGHNAIDLYAQAMDLPLYRGIIQGSAVDQGKVYTENQQDEVEDLYKLLKNIKVPSTPYFHCSSTADLQLFRSLIWGGGGGGWCGSIMLVNWSAGLGLSPGQNTATRCDLKTLHSHLSPPGCVKKMGTGKF